MQNKLVDLSQLNGQDDLAKELLVSALGVVQEVAGQLSGISSGSSAITDRSRLARFEKALASVRARVPNFGQYLPVDLVQSAVEIAKTTVL